jgi:hypothetical protein
LLSHLATSAGYSSGTKSQWRPMRKGCCCS